MSTGKTIALIKGIGGGSGSGGGASLPTAAPYQQLVTDGEGKWVAEERLAWKEGEKAEITWDGNTEGLTSVLFAYSNQTLYKVSSLSLSDNAIKNGTIYLANGREMPVSDLWGSGDNITEDIVYLDAVAFVRKENTDYKGTIFPEIGVYFADMATAFYSETKTIHPIPAEYLPGYFKLFVVTAANDGDFENNTYTANMTRDEAMAVLQNQPFALMKSGNKIYWLSIVLIQNDMFIMTFTDRSGEIEVTLMYNTDGTIVFFNP